LFIFNLLKNIRKMKVLHVSPYPTPHDARFFRAMLAAGEEVYYMPLDTGRPCPADWPDEIRPVTWRGLDSRHHLDPQAIRESSEHFSHALHAVRPHVVQAGPACSAGFLTALSKFHPYVAMLWGHDVLWDAKQSEILEAMAAKTLQSADAILCDCRTVREEAVRLAQRDDKIILQMPWGIDLGRYNPPPPCSGIRGQLEWRDKIVFVSARSWGPLYGIDTLLDGFALACRSQPHLRLLLIGDGPLRPMVEEKIRTHALARHVHLVGQVSEFDMPAFLGCGDYYVSCSRTDGSSITLLEAMALQLPPAVSDIPGNRDWVDDGIGWLFETDSPSGLSAVLLHAAAVSPARRASMGARARNKVIAGADFRSNVSRLLDSHALLVGRPVAD
jgi:glycosyltransferase involved in cell wall biosynthesis